MFADGTRRRESRLASLTDRLLAARESEGVDGQSAADGASKLNGDLILRQRVDELELSGRCRRCRHDDRAYEAERRKKRLSQRLYFIAKESEGMYRLIRPNHEAQGMS